jgi:hypothetical protein
VKYGSRNFPHFPEMIRFTGRGTPLRPEDMKKYLPRWPT